MTTFVATRTAEGPTTSGPVSDRALSRGALPVARTLLRIHGNRSGEDAMELTASSTPTQRLVPTRLYNWFARRSPSGGWDLHELLDTAMRKTGLDDWGDDDFEEGFQVLLDDLARDDGMTPWGRTLLRHILLQRLTDKLEIRRELARRPTLSRVPVRRPIFIVGPGRTGTTLLQRLLALDPQLRVPRYWELYYPTPAPDPASDTTDPRIAAASRELAFKHYLCPGLRVVHPMAATAADECLPLLDRAMFNPALSAWFHAPQYLDWVLQAPLERQVGRYRQHRAQLQLMRGTHPELGWVLKAPTHALFVHAIAHVYPDARFVVTHRSRAVALASLCSLIAVVRGLFYETVDLQAIGRLALHYSHVRHRRLRAATGTLRSNQVIDVHFDGLTAEPLRALRWLYPRLGLSFPAGHERTVQRFLDEQDRGHHRRHRYDLERFGLQADAIDDERREMAIATSM